MTLPRGMRSLLAYFPSSTRAEAAVQELKGMGINDVSLDRVSRYGVTTDAALNNPVNNAETATGLTMFSAHTSRLTDTDARVLTAADPSNYAMAADNYGTAGGKAFLVTVVTTDKLGEQAARVLKKHGGSL
ncbi:hypothetical protein [Desulforamulus hydrothermalis]|uniref:Uncharacterized protein n=1 Tax=Desulforamulus hydrothermalis Lam5 = DSM 18033 TaxID=1121428 RepID=K8DYJ4_9FIRM|nr:hypothetical protein [Desulforamulus hydrothermalis]CCO07962.1 conserved hypothetical protein [Desulforamulus hydrothermalis Lam5 = DSM 18033]SHG85289.1 hypothetical protein SAMN02745177_00595 [Desulforamulus hydrothermalis Lam5 = DSM 18033]